MRHLIVQRIRNGLAAAVLVPDPCWPPTLSIVLTAQAVPVTYPMYESRGWRPDMEEVARFTSKATLTALVLCALIFRAVSIEFRSKMQSQVSGSDQFPAESFEISVDA